MQFVRHEPINRLIDIFRHLKRFGYMRCGRGQKANVPKGQHHTVASAEECCRCRRRKCV